MPAAVATPNVLRDPGFLFIAPLATAEPTNTVAGGVFTDTWPVAWLPLGATSEGSDFVNSTEVETVTVAELREPIHRDVVSQSASIAFALANFTLTNYRRAMNGGVAALTATSGTGATGLYTLEPTEPGEEVRCMIGWESLDSTVRLVGRQCLQTGEVSTGLKRSPDIALIPCTFSLEKPSAAASWTMWGAGETRV